MIKIFRSVRKQLLEEGITTRYFKYAIGEIILVVIGILIALSINNWNNRNVKINNETELIASLIQELSNNIIKLDSDIQIDQNYMDKTKLLLNKFEKGSDRFSKQEISDALDYQFFVYNTPLLDDIILKSSDVLVHKKSMINDFRTLSSQFQSIGKSADYLDEFWNSQITPYYISCGIVYEPGASSKLSTEAMNFESSNYSKNQTETIIRLKYFLQQARKSKMENALLNARQTLEKLHKIEDQ